MTVHLETTRLVLEDALGTSRPEEFLLIFNSNLEYLAISEPDREGRPYDIADVEDYLRIETERENSWCLAIRRRGDGRLVGTAAVIAPHPREPVPWIGFLIMDAAVQGQGYGAEAAAAIEEHLAGAGWGEVRIGVLSTNPAARRFAESIGYRVGWERPNQDGLPCWILTKSLSTGVDA